MAAAKTHFQAQGRPDMRPVPIKHPVLGVGPEDLRAKADETVDKIIAVLTGKE